MQVYGTQGGVPVQQYRACNSARDGVDELVVDSENIHIDDGEYIISEEQLNLDGGIAGEIEIQEEEVRATWTFL